MMIIIGKNRDNRSNQSDWSVALYFQLCKYQRPELRI